MASRTEYNCRPTLEILCSSAKVLVESVLRTAVATDVSINVRRFMRRLYTKHSCRNATNNCGLKAKRKKPPENIERLFPSVRLDSRKHQAAFCLLTPGRKTR